jgi:antitoxin MazE
MQTRTSIRVGKWGNSLAVRIPGSVVDELSLKEGDDVCLYIAGARTIQLEKKPDVDLLIATIKRFRQFWPNNFKFDRNT